MSTDQSPARTSHRSIKPSSILAISPKPRFLHCTSAPRAFAVEQRRPVMCSLPTWSLHLIRKVDPEELRNIQQAY
jgi:hypothetical protein